MGSVADNFVEEREQKIFHARIIVDSEKVSVYLLLHDVVAVLVLELVDDGYLLVGFCLRRHFFTVDNNPRMENLLFYLFSEIVRHAAHECSLREIG